MNRKDTALAARMALLLAGALGVAMACMFAPLGPIEALVRATGFDELVPAAAPPLGLTARAVLALCLSIGLFVALIGPFVLGGTRPARPGRRTRSVRRSAPSGGLMRWLRERAARGDGPADGAPPKLRAADRHPDAPARAPLRAGRDLADAEPLPPVDSLAEADAGDAGDAGPVFSAALQRGDALTPLPVAQARVPDGQAGMAPDATADDSLPPEGDLPGLADRLESALATHGAAARDRLMRRGGPAGAPARLDESLDDALDAALRTLNAQR